MKGRRRKGGRREEGARLCESHAAAQIQRMQAIPLASGTLQANFTAA